MKPRPILLGVLLAGSAAALANAQAPTTTSTQMTVVRTAPSGFRAEYLAEIDEVGKKLIDLAQAVPVEKYSWRPAPGVRSFGEVFLHIVLGNSTLPSFLGVKKMDGVSWESEKTPPDKGQIVRLLKRSIENAKAAAANVADADLDRKVKTFGGREMTQRQVLGRVLYHMYEHLGQAIAYARVNGIAPPWTEGPP